MTCPCRNEGISFVSSESGKEMPKPCLGLSFLFLSLIFSSHRHWRCVFYAADV